MKIGSVAKSLIAGLTAGLGTLQVASADGRITAMEWVQIGSALVAAAGFVWGVPNTAPAEVAPAETPVAP